MVEPKCPLSGGELDKGQIRWGAAIIAYIPDEIPSQSFLDAAKHPIFDPNVSSVLSIRASACLDCGHLPQFVDPKALRKRVGR